MSTQRTSEIGTTRQTIFQNAIALFGSQGVEGTTLQEIGKASGVTVATVIHHYGSKDELYAAVIADLQSQLRDLVLEVQSVIRPTADVADLVGQIVRACFRFADARRSAIQVLFRAAIDRGDIGASALSLFHAPMLDQAAELLAGFTGRSADAQRLHVQHMIFMIARNVVSDRSALVPDFADMKEATQLVEDTLVRTGQLLLLGPHALES